MVFPPKQALQGQQKLCQHHPLSFFQIWVYHYLQYIYHLKYFPFCIYNHKELKVILDDAFINSTLQSFILK